MEFAEALPAIEAVMRRHVPPCYGVVAFEARPTGMLDVNPAPYVVELTIKRIGTSNEPPDWRLEMAVEIRAGWDAWEFQIAIRELVDDFQDSSGNDL
jgi:hypothetical protein